LGVKLTTNLHPMPRSRTRGAIPPLPNMPSWRGAQLKLKGKYISVALAHQHDCSASKGSLYAQNITDLISTCIYHWLLQQDVDDNHRSRLRHVVINYKKKSFRKKLIILKKFWSVTKHIRTYILCGSSHIKSIA